MRLEERERGLSADQPVAQKAITVMAIETQKSVNPTDPISMNVCYSAVTVLQQFCHIIVTIMAF